MVFFGKMRKQAGLQPVVSENNNGSEIKNEIVCLKKKNRYLCRVNSRIDNKNGVVVQLVRIPACHAGGRGFESRPYRLKIKQLRVNLRKSSTF